MIPIVGDAIGKGGKAARFIANKADDVLAVGRKIKCKVTGTGCFVAGTKVWLSATVDNNEHQPHRASDRLSPQLDHLSTAALLTPTRTIAKQAIETVAIGSRVSGDNPRPWDFDGELAIPDQSTWTLAKFSLQKEAGNWVDVEMIRPAKYWESQQAAPGSLIFMEFPELEASGMAQVRSIEPCPPIAEGSGNVVTARIVTRQVSELVEIGFDDDEILTGTPQHPIWSIERQDRVELGDLEIGEHLWTEDGPVEVQSRRLLTTAESVYNLEVHGHHIYQVGELGVLVHNAGPCALGAARKKAQQLKNKPNAPHMTSAVVDTKTGKVYYGFSQAGRAIRGKIAAKMKAILGKVKPDPKLNRSLMNCAEAQAFNRALVAGARAKNLVSATVVTRTGQAAAACRNCQRTVVPNIGRNLTG